MNIMQRLFLSGVILIGLIGLIACGSEDTVETSPTAVVTEVESSFAVVATVPLVADWVSEIVGPDTTVRSMIPYGINPHGYLFGAKDIAEVTESDIVFAVGLEYESKTFEKLMDAHPDLIVVNLGDFVDPIPFKESGHEGHDDHDDEDEHEGHDDHDDEDGHKGHDDHDDEDEHEGHDGHEGHDHGLYDPHFWFDPVRVASAVQIIADKMSEFDPNGAEQYQSRASDYLTKLNALDQDIQDRISGIAESKRIVMTSHESLGYLGARYELSIIRAVIPSFSADQEPGPGHLVEAIELIEDHEVQVIFLEAETSDATAKVVADEAGIEVVSGLRVETLRNRDEGYINFMEDNIELIVETLKNLP